MRIVLLRHGKAVNNEIMPDEDRYLTDTGKLELKQMLPYLADTLKSAEWEIWSSPLVRAKKTAEILLKSMKNTPLKIKDFVEKGSFEDLVHALQKTDAKNVVIVGHQPHLSDWVNQLTGEAVNFKKGSAAELEVPKDNPRSGILNWAVRGKDFKQLRKNKKEEDENRLFKNQILEKLDNYFILLCDNRQKFLENPGNPDTVHDFRVTIRSFRTMVSLLSKYLDKRIYQRIQNAFRMLASELSYLRELDVLIDVYDKVRKENNLSFEDSQLSVKLQNERNAEKERVAAAIENDHSYDVMTGNFILLLNSIKFKKIGNIQISEVILPKLDDWYETILNRIREYKNFNFSYIHDTRLKCKKYRYVSEIFSDFMDETHHNRCQDVKELQTILGNICDVIRNQETILEIVGSNAPEIQEEVNQLIQYEKRIEKEYKDKLDSREWLQNLAKPPQF